MREPFLKWAGGKRWLARSFSWLFPASYDRYVEPFLGGGAIFFAQEPSNALLSDANEKLVATYNAIRDDWQSVLAHLEEYAHKHSDNFYYEARATPQIKSAAEAARFIYLNRTCWNGLYRVNLRGEFNVPRGTKDRVLMETDDFEWVSSALQKASITTKDFEATLAEAGHGDFVFLDPPYTVAHNNNGFLKYNENIFSWSDQERLKEAAAAAAGRGASVLVLNAHHSSIEQLYDGVGTMHIVNRHSVISGSAGHRRSVEEVAIQIGYATSSPIDLLNLHDARYSASELKEA
ncbi:DNA adenine methylase [Bosea sp. BH3]|uniref:DNA adenine methylase n=1 Tax=Bosea sp. BH3 TaxID=2871701 RepID=UPI0021CB2509|nr:Dam family site-specific DNA-(adenine-N6)-methyltransferase [Bosea sp. BH3]MCU4180195.1 Dam family site-specific DNA-(adenine-N6)-methyltransferase [Bosea sp. BH3]